MHGIRGHGARDKMALMPSPLWKSSCGFTTLDQDVDMDCGTLGKTSGHSPPAKFCNLPQKRQQFFPIIFCKITDSTPVSFLKEPVRCD